MILVTGAGGHIGNVLVRKLVELGEEVRAFILPNEDRKPLEGMDIEIVEGNVLEYGSVKSALKGIKSVFHLAGLISILPGRDQLVQLVNVVGTKNILWAAMESGIERLVYTSSIHAFERLPHGEVITEDTPINPLKSVAAYDHSKAEATLAVHRAVSEFGLNAVIACPTGVIGPFDYRQSEMGLLIQGWMHHKINFLINGAYDFVDVRDVADGLLLAHKNGIAGERYILNGTLIKIPELLQLVKEISGQSSMDVILPTNLAKFVVNYTPTYYNITGTVPRLTSYSVETLHSNSVIEALKTRNTLKYAPRSIRRTIEDTIAWWRSQYTEFGRATK